MIYFIRHIETGLIKIGETNGLRRRVAELTNLHGAMELLGSMAGNRAKEAELHKQFADCNKRGLLVGFEWFSPMPELLEYIRANTTIKQAVKDTGAVARIPVSKETLSMLSDMAYGAGFNYSQLLLFMLWKEGVDVNDPESIKRYALSIREKIHAWKLEKSRAKMQAIMEAKRNAE